MSEVSEVIEAQVVDSGISSSAPTGRQKYPGRPVGIIEKHPRNIKASARQIKVAQYLAQGMSRQGAFIKAGYSWKTAHASQQKVQGKTIQKELQKQLVWLDKYKVNSERIAQKLDELLEHEEYVSDGARGLARDKEGNFLKKPDGMIQLAALRTANQIIQQEKRPMGEGRIKRELSIREYITGSDEK